MGYFFFIAKYLSHIKLKDSNIVKKILGKKHITHPFMF